MVAESRWPPIYDFEQLTTTIRAIVDDGQPLEKRIYEGGDQRESFFQGDVIRLSVEFPFVGAEGQVEVSDAPPFWVVVGNTCDMAREVDDVAYTQLAPVCSLGARTELTPAALDALRRYKYYTQFYLPPWDRDSGSFAFVADFLRPACVHKRALEKAEVVARLNRRGWVLFHSCVVRFLARDDGRHD